LAKIKLNSLLADLRGRFGSVVVSSNRSGGYIKSLVVPSNPRSALQNAQRLMFSRLVYGWNLLDAPTRALWLTYSQRADNERLDWFGDPYYPDSRQQYISLNLLRLSAGDSVTDTPPTSALPPALPDLLGIVCGTGAIDSYLDVDSAPDPDIVYVVLHVALASNPGRSTPPHLPRFVAVYPVASGFPWNVQSLLDALYGPITQTGFWWFDVYPVSADFRLGSVSRISALINSEYP
jgi:hypothetical protein